MATNRDLLKEAIADAKAVKETAIANAKAALEEAFTPFLKEKLAAKINEIDEADEMMNTEDMYTEAENENENAMMEMEEDMLDEVSLDELLAELEEEKDKTEETYTEEEITEAEEMKAEEEVSIEDMSEEDLKSCIEDVIKDMVAAGELEAGEEGEEMEDEEEGEEIEAEEEEEVDLDELLAEAEEEKIEEEVVSGLAILAGLGAMGLLAGGATVVQDKLEKAAKEDPNGKAAKILNFLRSTKTNVPKGGANLEEDLKEAYSTIKTLKSELHEINLLNAKLLYTNKIFRNKSLTESQKIKVLTAFDKATSKKEVELVYETLQESLRVSTTKAPIKESLGSASKTLGGVTSKPIIENDAFSRMRELAFGKNK